VLWLGLIVLDGLIVVVLIVALMRVMANWRLSELRDALLNRAYDSWTFQGEPLPGAKPSLVARVIIRLLSR
jgi:hypothetical protein